MGIPLFPTSVKAKACWKEVCVCMCVLKINLVSVESNGLHYGTVINVYVSFMFSPYLFYVSLTLKPAFK